MVSMSDEFFTGTCDVDHNDVIVDVKASWNKTTLHKQILDGMDADYEWQLQGYCHLYKKPKGILFFGLMDTPPDINFGNEVIYSDLPDNERWVAYSTLYDADRIEMVKLKVLQCREYLNEYDALVKSKLGRIV